MSISSLEGITITDSDIDEIELLANFARTV